MNEICKLLDIAKNRNTIKSDRALARALGITNVVHYRKRNVIPDDTTALKLAELCGLPPEQVLITCHLAKAEKGAVHDAWNKVLKMAANACIGVILAGSIALFPAPSTSGAVYSGVYNNIHYATLFLLASLMLIAYLTLNQGGTL